MPLINEHYLKLTAGYLFPEIARRVDEYLAEQPDARNRLIKSGIGDVTEPLPLAARLAMHEAVDELGRRDTFRGYGPPFGYDFLREAIAEGDFSSRGMDIEPDEIFLSDGSKVDCGAILDILVQPVPGEANNRVAITDPVYPVYVDTNVMVGNTGQARDDGRYDQLIYMPCTAENDFIPDLPDEKLDVIYLCYPNNPTGSMITRPQLEQWIEYAMKHEAIILYDVAYQAFIQDENLPRSIYEIKDARKCAIELHSFSKNGGFTGVRCGYTVCPKQLTGRTRSGKRIPLHDLWQRRWSTKSNGVSYIVQRGAAALYTERGQEQVDELVKFYLGNAAILRDSFRTRGLEVYGGQNAPYVWVACPEGVPSWDMFDRLLRELHIVTTPGVGFGQCGEGYFRVSAFNSRANVEEIVRRMKALASSSVETS